MPTPIRSRRFKPILVLVVLFTLTILYVTSSARHTRNSEYYQRTQAELRNQRNRADDDAATANALDSDTDVAKRLKDAADQAKAAADRKGDEHRARLGMEELPEKNDDENEKSAAGKKGMKAGTAKENAASKSDADAADVAGPPNNDQMPVKGQQGVETEDEHKVEQELNAILKRSPIIIFSKTFCPYSKKAKRVLLDQYKITPAPYVVELDEHTLGSELQTALGDSTGRRTVPNVLINGKSIGGGDDIEALHKEGELANTIKKMGGKRIMEVTLVETHIDSDFKSEVGPKRRAQR